MNIKQYIANEKKASLKMALGCGVAFVITLLFFMDYVSSNPYADTPDLVYSMTYLVLVVEVLVMVGGISSACSGDIIHMKVLAHRHCLRMRTRFDHDRFANDFREKSHTWSQMDEEDFIRMVAQDYQLRSSKRSSVMA